jgi:hypothetical protein
MFLGPLQLTKVHPSSKEAVFPTMFSPNLQALQACCLIPRKPEIVLIGKTSVLLYPKVDTTMSDLEKALAYQQNCTALATANLDQRARILALAERLDLMLTAESSLADWK